MTQEELDALMNDDVDIESMDDAEVESQVEKPAAKASASTNDANWPPPAPTDDNKMVHQLDDVTRESELKASEIFDIIETIGDDMMNAEERINSVKAHMENTVNMLTLLSEKFPSIQTFKTALAENQESLSALDDEIAMLQDNGDQIMNVMDIMQYQDIHRQKIERVINVMRALSKYMNTLFAGQKEDSERVSSAQHIYGDTNTEDVMSDDDIEALLNSFGSGDITE